MRVIFSLYYSWLIYNYFTYTFFTSIFFGLNSVLRFPSCVTLLISNDLQRNTNRNKHGTTEQELHKSLVF